MVVTVSLHHVFTKPAKSVFQCYIENFTSISSDRVKTVENLHTKEDGEMQCTTRIITLFNFFPTIFQRMKMLKTETVKMEEECWSEESNNRYWIRSRNITWPNDVAIAHSAFLSPDPHRSDWCRWAQESYVDFSCLGKLGTVLELYMKRHIEAALRNQFSRINTLLQHNSP